uniref:Uncharacterized protein n=1 Tax=Mustela putorius furo TaxID=9669 RepID=M3XWM6_MUSPF
MTSLGSCIPLRRFGRNVRCYDHPRNRLPVGTGSKASAVNAHMDSSSTRNLFNQPCMSSSTTVPGGSKCLMNVA